MDLKQEVLKYISEQEFLEKNKEFEETAKELGVNDGEIQQYILQRWTTYLSRIKGILNNIPHINVDAVFFGVSKTDFGAAKAYAAAKDYYEKNPEEAVSQQIVDAEGNPLYTSGFRKGEKINPEKAVVTFLLGAFKTKEGWIAGKMKATDEVLETVKLYSLYEEISVIPNNKNKRAFTASKATVLKKPLQLTVADLKELAEKVDGMLVSVSEAMKIADDGLEKKLAGNQIDFDKFYLIIGNLLNNVILTDESKSTDVMRLNGNLVENDGEYNMPLITVWLNKNNKFLQKRIIEDAINVIVCGNPYARITDDGTKEYFVNAAGTFVDQAYIAPEPQPIKEQPTDDNTDSSFE